MIDNPSKTVETETVMPNFGAKPSGYDPAKYRVRYLKANMSDTSDIAMLEEIETRGLLGKDIILFAYDKFTFMQDYFVILRYLEKRT